MLGGVSPEYAINLGYFDGTLQQMANNKPQSVTSMYTDIENVNHFRQQNLSSLTPVTAGKANWTALVYQAIMLTIKTKCRNFSIIRVWRYNKHSGLLVYAGVGKQYQVSLLIFNCQVMIIARL
jgi:hypothetical protein